VTLIEDLIKTAAVEIARSGQPRLGSHGKTPAFGGSAPRNRHSTMLREYEESFSLNQLWVVQGRLFTGPISTSTPVPHRVYSNVLEARNSCEQRGDGHCCVSTEHRRWLRCASRWFEVIL
jgi:hypothetical protein